MILDVIPEWLLDVNPLQIHFIRKFLYCHSDIYFFLILFDVDDETNGDHSLRRVSVDFQRLPKRNLLFVGNYNVVG